MCGEHAGVALVAFGVLVILFGLLVVAPTIVLAMRLVRASRRAGGCDAWVQEPHFQSVVVLPSRVQQHAAFAGQGPPPRDAPVGVPVGADSSVPVATAVPIRASAVRAAPSSMH